MSRKRRTPEDEPYLVIRSSSASVPHGFQIRPHAHPWHQLIFASAGVMTVETPLGHWVVTPQSGVWAPAGNTHAIRFSGASNLRTLYLRPQRSGPALPSSCTAIVVSALLRELIHRVTELGALDRRHADERALAHLVRAELGSAVGVPPIDLCTPTSEPLRELTQQLSRDPSPELTTARLAKKLGLGTRTLERRFLAETGVTLYQWRRQARMLKALERFAQDTPLKQVAEEAGYRTPSAFVAAFHATLGAPPRRYLARLLRPR